MQLHHQFCRRRKGGIAVLTAIGLIMLLGMVAFAVDIGYLLLARTELQRSADAAALAAAWELIDEGELSGSTNLVAMGDRCRDCAIEFAGSNGVLGEDPSVASGDITIGYLSEYSNPSADVASSGTSGPNAITVRVARNDSINGRVPFFLAGMLGVQDANAEAEATAAVLMNFGGFRIPPSGSNLGFLPFALDEESWNALLGGVGTDSWRWNKETGTIQSGSDGILELNLYPQGTGSPGNRGTVDVGSSNNSTDDIARQILYGVTPQDLEYHGGVLQLDENGELILNGDTGISAGVKDELASVKGKPRIVPLFRSVTEPGDNAVYTIVGFAGIRIMDVKLSGPMSGKRVIIQPAQIVAEGGIPAPAGSTSNFVYSPPWIVR